MKTINCAVVSSYFGPYYSNFVASMIAFDKKMKKEGHTVFYILPKETEKFEWIDTLKKQNNNIYFLEYKPYSINNYFNLRRIFKRERADLIYSHMCGWDLTARFAAPFTPVIWHMHMNVNIKNKVKRIKNWIKFRILGFGKTYHIAVSEPVTKAINSLKPYNKCVTIHNCIDFSRLKINKEKEKSDAKRILIFGWAPYVKGLDIALDACEKLIKENKKIKLLISAQEKTYEYLNHRYLRLPSWIELLEPTSDISSLYNMADIMLSASRSEGFSFALAEAIYSGLITVVSSIEGTSWSREFDVRFEFKSQDSESLKTILDKAIEYNITTKEQDSNRSLIDQKYSIDSWVQAVYEQINLIFKK